MANSYANDKQGRNQISNTYQVNCIMSLIKGCKTIGKDIFNCCIDIIIHG